jgi:hypothetical protein
MWNQEACQRYFNSWLILAHEKWKKCRALLDIFCFAIWEPARIVLRQRCTGAGAVYFTSADVFLASEIKALLVMAGVPALNEMMVAHIAQNCRSAGLRFGTPPPDPGTP